jgi:hypothetical protein
MSARVRGRWSLALVALVVFAIPSGGSAAGPPEATLFVSADGYDSSPCTRRMPCRTFADAYRQATPGQVVEVAAGAYPRQRIDAVEREAAAPVVFRPAAGASVSVEAIELGQLGGTHGASHISIEDMTVQTTISAWYAEDVTFARIQARNFYLNSVQDTLVLGGSYGPCRSSVDPCGNSKIDLSTPEHPNRNVTIDGAVFHDYRAGRASDHFECLLIFSGTQITIRNSRFYNCEYFDVLLEDHRYDPSDRPLGDVVIESNWFDAPWDGPGGKQGRASAVAFSLGGAGISHVLVRFNSFHERTGLIENTSGNPTAMEDFRVIGNLLGSDNICFAGASYAYNVRTGSRPCNETEKRVPSFGYVNGQAGAAFDAHLTEQSPARDTVRGAGAAYAVPDDLDGDPRGFPRDAGADASRDR